MSSFRKTLSVLALYVLTINLNVHIRQYHSTLIKKQHLPLYFPVACYLSAKNIAADFYWFCLSSSEELSPEYVFHVADFITDLDPHFTVVYRFVGIYLTTQTDRYDLAVNLLKKGLASPVNSADWRISFYIFFCIDCIDPY